MVGATKLTSTSRRFQSERVASLVGVEFEVQNGLRFLGRIAATAGDHPNSLKRRRAHYPIGRFPLKIQSSRYCDFMFISALGCFVVEEPRA